VKTAVQKWGNSLALRIPKAYATEARIKAGSEVELSLSGGALVAVPVRLRQKRVALADLLKRVTATNQHREVPTGPPIGGEVW
jgi:antitoxin MazE